MPGIGPGWRRKNPPPYPHGLPEDGRGSTACGPPDDPEFNRRPRNTLVSRRDGRLPNFLVQKQPKEQSRHFVNLMSGTTGSRAQINDADVLQELHDKYTNCTSNGPKNVTFPGNPVS